MLAMRSNVVIPEEPAASLDPDSAEDVFSAIESLHRERRITAIVREPPMDRLPEFAGALAALLAGPAMGWLPLPRLKV